MANRTSFKTKKETERRKRISESNYARWEKIRKEERSVEMIEVVNNVKLDHSYSQWYESKPECSSDSVDINFFECEEVLGDGSESELCENSKSWINGRRVVELDCLVDRLSACINCTLPLELTRTSIIGETRHGLGGTLKIKCSNHVCSKVNNVPLGKRHSSTPGKKAQIWDVNTKIAAGNYSNFYLFIVYYLTCTFQTVVFFLIINRSISLFVKFCLDLHCK